METYFQNIKSGSDTSHLMILYVDTNDNNLDAF